jgi:iron complex outermembrane recepter protein
MRSIQSRILAGVSLAAISVIFPVAAQAQDDQGAQCNSISDAEERARCLEQASPSAPTGQSATSQNVESPAGIQNTGEDLPPAISTADEESILVTGSRIARPNYDTVEPAVVVSSEDIETRGFETLGQALNELPAFGIPGSSPVSGQSSFGPGQSFVNFLGLGDQRTLTLVNSNRFVSSNTSSLFGPTGSGSQVDLNVIPTALIDRVEVIAVGGAPIYGSDAIAGTVNVILKRNFEGFQIDGQYGISQYGDVPNYRIRGLGGINFASGRGNVTFSGEYQRQGGLIFTDREVLRRGEFFDIARQRGAPFTNEIYSQSRVSIVVPTGIPLVGDFFPLDPGTEASVEDFAEFFGLDLSNPAQAAYAAFLQAYFPTQDALYCAGFGYCGNFTNSQGQALRFDPSGNLVPIDFGVRPGPNPLPLQFFSEGGNGFDLNQVSNLLSPLERYSAVGLINYEFSDNLRFSGEAWYSHSQGTELVDQPAYNSAAFGGAGEPGGNLIIRADNPFLSPQARAIIQAQAPNLPELGGAQGFYFARANTDISTRRASGEVDIYRFVAGLEGNFDVGDFEWRWDVTGNYGRSRTKGRNPELLEQNFNNAVDATTDAAGNIICRPGSTNSPFPSVSSTCAPLNLFGQFQASQAAIDYITGFSTPRSLNQQYDFIASLTGDLFQLPGGNLGFAVGYEHRKESFDFDPGPLLLGGPDDNPAVDSDGDGDPTNDCASFTRDACITPVAGSFNTDEFFSELRAPIVSPSNDVPFIYQLELKAAFRWVDHSSAGGDPAWTVGGRWSPIRDITFRGNYTRSIRSPAVGEISLPTSPGFFFATDPCDADNLDNGPDPATRQANCLAAGIPPTFQSRSSNATFAGVTVGNPDLENERAKAWTVGVVLQPSFIPGLTASADYVDIHIDNAISFFGATSVLNACYDSQDFPNVEFCDRFTRSTTPGSVNQLNFIETSFFNADTLDYQGILFDVDYRRDTPFLGADSHIGLSMSAQYVDKLEQASGAGLPVINRGLIGNSKFSAVAAVTYTTDAGLLLQVSANHTGPARQSVTDNTTFNPNRVDSFTFVNAAFAYDVNEQFSFRFSVDNILGADFPDPGPAGGGVITYFPSILGTYFRAGATVRF